MQPFDYYRPRSLDEASQLLAQADLRARVLSGGVDLLPKMEMGLVTAGSLLDIKHLPETTRFEFEPGRGLWVGAAITLKRLCEQADVRRHFPLLAQVAERIASPQIRSRATLGGALCAALSNSSLTPVLLCHDAVCHLIGPERRRSLPLAAFFTGPGQTTLSPGEILTSLHLPAPERAAKAAFHQVRSTQHRHGPLAGVAAMGSAENERGIIWRVAVTGAGPFPYRVYEAEQLLAGRSWPAPSGLAPAIDAIVRSCQPSDDPGASAAYRRDMVAVLARRSLEEVVAYLSGGSV